MKVFPVNMTATESNNYKFRNCMNPLILACFLAEAGLAPSTDFQFFHYFGGYLY